jgi:type IV secretory pathway TrbF-like protein
MKRVAQSRELQEIAGYTKYYEHDGMLRAYANRAMFLAVLFGVLALGSLAFAIYVRLQPPTVIRVDKNGDATVLGGPGLAGRGFSLLAERASAADPSDIEGRATVRQFLEDYLAYTSDSVDRNMAAALNMMTTNLRTYTLNQLREKNTIGKIKDNHIISEFEIRSIEPVNGLPWTYTVFGVKEVHHVKQGTERIDQIVGRYNVRLVETRRTVTNPSGLLVAEYSEQEMVGDRETGLLQQDAFDKDRQ